MWSMTDGEVKMENRADQCTKRLMRTDLFLESSMFVARGRLEYFSHSHARGSTEAALWRMFIGLYR